MLNTPRAASAALLAAMLFSPPLSRAMEIQKFDKMADADQGEYIAELVQGAQKVLIADGKADLAAETHRLFTTKIGDDIFQDIYRWAGESVPSISPALASFPTRFRIA